MIFEATVNDIYGQELTPAEGHQIRPHKEARETRPPHSLTIVVAAAADNAIGRSGDMIWHIREDLRHFKEITKGGSVVMGRKTWESLPRKPLPGRRNIVITRSPEYPAEGAELAGSLDEALKMTAGDSRIFIIGGGEIYRQAIPLADCVELTRIEAQAPEADTFFPELSETEWKLTASSELFPASDQHPPFRYLTYRRR